MGHHSTSDAWLALTALSFLAMFVFAVLRWLDEKIRGKPQQNIEPDLVAESLRIVSTPMPLPGGRWGRYKTELEECAPPMKQGELVVHDRTNPNHVANCPECKDGRKFRGSGISYRTN